jgi:TRAP-type uncharacterized transport system substrate-binding protein
LNANGMTIRGQRLDPPWRAYVTVGERTPGGERGVGFRGLRRGGAGVALLAATLLGGPSLAEAAGAPSQVQPQAQPQESPAAPEPPVVAQAAPVPAPTPTPHPVPPAATAAQVPTGMVRYERPLFHNGHYVLWHGAWRDGVHAARAAPAKPEPSVSEAAARAKPPDFVILADSADAEATRMAGEFAAAMQNGPAHVRVAAGRTSTAALDKAAAADAADLAIAPLDGLIAAGRVGADRSPADWRLRNPYVLRLCSEPIELIAPRALTDVSQLSGRKVSVGPADSAAAESAAIVFSRLNVAPTLTHEDTAQALTGLAGGSVDAVFLVGADRSRALADFDKSGRFHLIAIPYAPALQGLYHPMRLTSRELPNLVGDDEKVDTIGVTTALVALDAASKSPRAERIAPLASQLFSGFEQLRAASDDSDWREVNLTARINGWPRLEAAQSWLDQNQGAANPALDAFRNLAQSAAGEGDGPSAADSDRLYESLMQWSGAAQ